MHPRVSIVIPCYNHATFLSEAIDSALGQDYPNVEVIVVDDGSSDDSMEVALRYGARIRLVRQPNSGLAAARNAGIKAGKGEFVVCLDADDRILPRFCSETVPVLAGDATVGVVATGWRFFGAANRRVIPRCVPFVEHLAHNAILCTSLFRRQDWEWNGGFDESMRAGFEDWEFWIRLRKSGMKLAVVPRILLEYRRHGTSMLQDSYQRSHEILQVMHDKHRDVYQTHCAAIHAFMYGLLHRSCSLTELYEEAERPEGWRNKIPDRVKHLAKAVLPGSMIEFMRRRGS